MRETAPGSTPTRWRVPSGYTPAQLVVAIRHARAHPGDTYTPVSWTARELTAAEYLTWFRRTLHAKISTLGGRQPVDRQPRHMRRGGRSANGGRKLGREYAVGLSHDAARLRGYGGFGRRLETPEVRRRLRADHVHAYGERVVVCVAASEQECTWGDKA